MLRSLNKLPQYPGTQVLNIFGFAMPDGLTLKSLHMGITPNKPWYGHIMAVIECDGHVYECRFRVREPGQTGSLANQMTDIQEIVSHDGPFPYYTRKDTEFGGRAFWQNTPDSTLSGNDLLLRQFMRALKAYSVKNQLCKKFRQIERTAGNPMN